MLPHALCASEQVKLSMARGLQRSNRSANRRHGPHSPRTAAGDQALGASARASARRWQHRRLGRRNRPRRRVRNLHLSKGGPRAWVHSLAADRRLPLLLEPKQFRERLAELGFDAGAEQIRARSRRRLFYGPFDRNIAGRRRSHGFGRACAAGSGRDLVDNRRFRERRSLLRQTQPSDVQRELGRLGHQGPLCSQLARDFFARLVRRSYSNTTSAASFPNHVGPGKGLRNDRLARSNSVAALERHCREAALIVEAFAGGWYSKMQLPRHPDLSTAQGFWTTP